jgi:hypothetical protein
MTTNMIAVRCRSPPDRKGNDMSGHERQDGKDKYTGNGYKPRPITDEDPGGRWRAV